MHFDDSFFYINYSYLHYFPFALFSSSRYLFSFDFNTYQSLNEMYMEVILKG